MAPTPTTLQPTSTSSPTMSNPNTNVLAFNRRSGTRLPDYSDMRVVYIGKDQQPVNLPKMASINSDSWKKSASFDILVNSVDSLVDAHSVADVVSLVSNELPIDTSASFQEAQAAAKTIINSVLNPNFLEPVAFLNSVGSEVKIGDPTDLSTRPVDITYIRFRCHMHASSVDDRVVNAPELSFNFSLKLPQHTYNASTNTVTKISTPQAISPSKSNLARSLSSCFDASSTSSSKVSTSTPTAQQPTTSKTKSSPAMAKFLSAQKSSTGDKEGYYGDLDFLDSQVNFNSTFGKAPVMLHTSPTKMTTVKSCQTTLREYSDICKLEIFLHLCQLNYVGQANVDVSLNTLDICSEISKLKQVYCVNGIVHHNTPDELFDRISSLAVSLPVDASKWSIQLCSCYLTALSKDLHDALTSDDKFIMPDLTKLTSKSLQLDALRKVREFATASYKTINKQKTTLQKLIQEVQPSRHRGTALEVHADLESDNNPSGYALSYQQGASLAERTIGRYSQPNEYNKPNSFRSQIKVETRKHPVTGVEHPYDKDRNFLSRFPLGFKGCFNCGQNDHFSTRNCPMANAGNFDKQTFFSEMWAHKPHTKKQSRDNNRSLGDIQIENNQLNRNGPFNQLNRNGPFNQSNGNNSINQLNQNGSVNQLNQYTPFNQFGRNHNFDISNQNGNHANSLSRIDNIDRTIYGPQLDNRQVSFQNGANESNNSLRQQQSHHGEEMNCNSPLKQNIDNTPAWMKAKGNNGGNTPEQDAKKDSGTQRRRLWMIFGSILNIGQSNIQRPMPLSIDNNLPAAVFRFGSTSENEIPFPCHVDSCAAMNTANLLLYMWIITKYPAIVDSYKQFDDAYGFCPLGLDTAVPASDVHNMANKLTAIVTYKTRYVDSEGKNMTLSFGLGEAIKVNAIIGLPTFKEWKLVLDLDENRLTSKSLGIYFDLCFEHAATGFPPGITFNRNDFIRPPRKTSSSLALLTQCAASLENKNRPSDDNTSVVIDMENGASTYANTNVIGQK